MLNNVFKESCTADYYGWPFIHPTLPWPYPHMWLIGSILFYVVSGLQTSHECFFFLLTEVHPNMLSALYCYSWGK